MRYLAVMIFVLLLASSLAACFAVPSTAPRVAAAASSSAVASPSGPAATADAKVQTISPADAKKLLDAETGIVLVDVRTANEYSAGHIAGSMLIPLENIVADAAAKLPDKGATILVYCRTGIRGAQAATKLMDMGYTHVFNIAGGITAWTYGTVKN